MLLLDCYTQDSVSLPCTDFSASSTIFELPNGGGSKGGGKIANFEGWSYLHAGPYLHMP